MSSYHHPSCESFDENTLLLDLGKEVSPEELLTFSQSGKKVKASPAVRENILASRHALEKLIEDGAVIYGVNTGMGGFVHKRIPLENASELQNNLIQAVASNVGPLLEDSLARATMLARIISLSLGNSAISLENFDRFIAIYNAGLVPEIPCKGSLGTSGDLGPLAAMARMLTAQGGYTHLDGVRMPAEQAFAQLNLTPLRLSHKEGLALINGTSCMVALAADNIMAARKLLDDYLAISGLTCEALRACIRPFHPDVHRLKPHLGQRHIAEQLWHILDGSGLTVDDHKLSEELRHFPAGQEPPEDMAIEDAYSIRCTPQILGPVWETIEFVYNIVSNEINSSSDNPLIIGKTGQIFHNGHFHGQYIAAAMDYLATSVITLCNLSDRRIDRLLTKANSKGLPAFLCAHKEGLQFGLMGGQFMSTSLTAENRSLGTPVSIQTLPSTGDFQDIVSFGLIAARKTRDIIQNTRYVIAFELICAAQAVELRGAEKLSLNGKKWLHQIRQFVPFLKEDISLTQTIEVIVANLLSGWHAPETRHKARQTE